MSMLTREEILAAADLVREVVFVPEWGGPVIVSSMSGEARDAWELTILAARANGAGGKNVRARLVAATVIDEQGQRLFTDADVEALGKKSGAALDRVFEVAERLNRLLPQDLEDLGKNSGPGQNGATGSDSPPA